MVCLCMYGSKGSKNQDKVDKCCGVLMLGSKVFARVLRWSQDHLGKCCGVKRRVRIMRASAAEYQCKVPMHTQGWRKKHELESVMHLLWSINIKSCEGVLI